jgi:hypothetical protein
VDQQRQQVEVVQVGPVQHQLVASVREGTEVNTRCLGPDIEVRDLNFRVYQMVALASIANNAQADDRRRHLDQNLAAMLWLPGRPLFINDDSAACSAPWVGSQSWAMLCHPLPPPLPDPSQCFGARAVRYRVRAQVAHRQHGARQAGLHRGAADVS